MATTFDAPTLVILGGIIDSIIGSIATGIVSIITAIRIKDAKDERSVMNTRIDTIGKDTEAIKGHVNSEKTASQGREASLQKENQLLREMLSDKDATAALLAQAVASRHGRSSDSPRPTDGKLDTLTATTLATLDAAREIQDKGTTVDQQILSKVEEQA